jgi:hypothetical protein
MEVDPIIKGPTNRLRPSCLFPRYSTQYSRVRMFSSSKNRRVLFRSLNIRTLSYKEVILVQSQVISWRETLLGMLSMCIRISGLRHPMPPMLNDIERYENGQTTKDKNIINSNLLGFSHSVISFTHIQKQCP